MIRFMKHFRWMFPQKMENGQQRFCLYLDCSLLAADGNQIEILTGNKDSARIIGGLTL